MGDVDPFDKELGHWHQLERLAHGAEPVFAEDMPTRVYECRPPEWQDDPPCERALVIAASEAEAEAVYLRLMETPCGSVCVVPAGLHLMIGDEGKGRLGPPPAHSAITTKTAFEWARDEPAGLLATDPF